MMAYKANDPVWVKYSPYSPWWPALLTEAHIMISEESWMRLKTAKEKQRSSQLQCMKVTSAKKIKPFNCPEKSRLVATGEKLEEKRRLAFQKDYEYVVQSGNVNMNPADVNSGVNEGETVKMNSADVNSGVNEGETVKMNPADVNSGVKEGETSTNTADNSDDLCLNLQNTSTAGNSSGSQEDALAKASNDLVDLRLSVPDASAVESLTFGDSLDRAGSESEALNSHSENNAGVDPNVMLECCKTGMDSKLHDNSLPESTNLCGNTEISQSTSVSVGDDKKDVEITIGENNVSGFSENAKRSDSSNVEGDIQDAFDHGIDLQLPDNSVTKETSVGDCVYKESVENDSETTGLTEGSQNFVCSDYEQGAPKTSNNESDVKLLDSSAIICSASSISGENSAAATSGPKSDSILDLNHVGSDSGLDLTGKKPVQNLAPDVDLGVENNVSGKDNAPRPSDPEPLNDSGIGSQFQTHCEESVAAERPDDSSRDVVKNELGSVELASCEKTEIEMNPSSLMKIPESDNVLKEPSCSSRPQIANKVENSVSEGNSEVQKRGRGRRKCSPSKAKSVSISPRRSSRVTAAPHRLDMNDVSPAKRKRKVSTNVHDDCSNTVTDTCMAEVSNSKRKRKVSLALNDQDNCSNSVEGPSMAERKRKDNSCSNTVADTGAEKAGSGRGIKKARTQSAPSKRLAKKSAKAEDKCSNVNPVEKSETKKKSNSTCRKLQAIKDGKLCGEKAVLTGRGRKRAQTLPLQPDLLSSPDQKKKRKINGESEKSRESSPPLSRNIDALLESLKTPSKLLKSRVERKIKDSPPVRGRVSKRRKTLEETEVAAESVCTDNAPAKSVSNSNDLGQLKLSRDNSPELGLGPFQSSQPKSRSPHLETEPDTVDKPPSCQSKNCDSSLQSKHRDYSPDLGLGPSRSSQPRNGSPHLDLETEPDTLDEAPNYLSKCDSSIPSEQRSEVIALDELQTTSKLLQSRAKPARKARKPAAAKPARNVKNKKGTEKTKSSVYAGLLEDLENPVADCLGCFESPVPTSDDAAPTEGKENCDESEATAAIAKRMSVMPYDPNVDWSGDSCKEDEEDDDDDLPEAFCSSPAHTFSAAPKFSQGDFVWVKWSRYPYWPCMIRRVYYTKKKLDRLSVLFVGDFFEKGQKGIKVRYTNKGIRCYSCPERAQFIDEGKNSVCGPQFETALNLIEEYITKKGLGLTKQTSLEYFAYEEETWTDDEEDTPVDAGTEETRLKATVEESREEDDSEDDDLDTDVLNISSDTPTSKRLAEIKMTRRDRYKEMVAFIQSEEVKNYLFDIYMGKKKSLLHDQFKVHPSGSKDTCFGPIDDDNQIEEIQNTLMTWFNEIHTGSSIDVTNNLNYVHRVWVPEAIVYAMRKTKHYTTKTAWERFEKGVYWTKVEHDNAHHAILNAVQNTSAESLEIHRMRTEAKSKKFLSVY